MMYHIYHISKSNNSTFNPVEVEWFSPIIIPPPPQPRLSADIFGSYREPPTAAVDKRSRVDEDFSDRTFVARKMSLLEGCQGQKGKEKDKDKDSLGRNHKSHSNCLFNIDASRDLKVESHFFVLEGIFQRASMCGHFDGQIWGLHCPPRPKVSFQNSFKYLDRSSVRFATPIESKLGIGHTKPDNFFNLPSVTSYSSSVQLKNKDLNETLILRTEVSIAPVRR